MNETEFHKFLQEVTKKEMQVLKLFLKGHGYSEIVIKLQITEGTAKAHICHIYENFGLKENRNNKDKLIKLFCRFKRDWVSHKFRYELDRLRPDEFFHLENVRDNLCLIQGIECLTRGVECPKKQERQIMLQKAIDKFEDAIYAEPTDPISRIFLNNAQAYMQSVKLPLKIAVVVAYSPCNKYHAEASKDVLRGVAYTQAKFNSSGGKNGQLLEVIIVDDDDPNQPKVSRKLAEDLSEWKDIVAIIGHHSSEGTQAAVRIYEENSIAVISPTSLSSKLRGKTFFRTIGSTEAIANEYVRFLREYLKSDLVAIFYHKDNEYSQTLKDDFEQAFKDRCGQIIEPIFDMSNSDLDIAKSIEYIRSKTEVALVISSIETNSVALAIARRNSKFGSKKLKLLFSTSLPERLILEIGGDILEEVFLVCPNLAEESDYIKGYRLKQQKINWRFVNSYSATNALVDAIKLSEQTTRKQILNNLKSISACADNASKFGLHWSNLGDCLNNQKGYCISQICNGEIKEIT